MKGVILICNLKLLVNMGLLNLMVAHTAYQPGEAKAISHKGIQPGRDYLAILTADCSNKTLQEGNGTTNFSLLRQALSTFE
jgi:hypothetical protein